MPKPFYQLAPVILIAGGLACVPAAEAGIIDATGDFLPTYTAAAQNSDLDVIAAGVTWDPAAQTFRFQAQMAGDLSQTTGALYVWGLDRGQGTERFLAASPAIGAGVFFDSVLILRPDGTGVFNDFISGTPTNLLSGTVQILGDTLTTNPLPLSLFPSTGDDPADYTWNLWPRVGLGSNQQISDFAPDGANAAVTVPEPGTWMLMGLALGLGPGLRHRRGRHHSSAA